MAKVGGARTPISGSDVAKAAVAAGSPMARENARTWPGSMGTVNSTEGDEVANSGLDRSALATTFLPCPGPLGSPAARPDGSPRWLTIKRLISSLQAFGEPPQTLPHVPQRPSGQAEGRPSHGSGGGFPWRIWRGHCESG